MADDGRGFVGLRRPFRVHNREGVAARAKGRLPGRKPQGNGLATAVEQEVWQDVPLVIGAGEAEVSSPELNAPPRVPVPRPDAVRIEEEAGEGLSQPEAVPEIEALKDRRQWLLTPPPLEIPDGVNRVNPSRLVHQVMPGEIAEVILTIGGLVATEEGLGHLDAAGGQLALGQVEIRCEGGPPGLLLADQEPIERRFQLGIGSVALI